MFFIFPFLLSYFECFAFNAFERVNSWVFRKWQNEKSTCFTAMHFPDIFFWGTWHEKCENEFIVGSAHRMWTSKRISLTEKCGHDVTIFQFTVNSNLVWSNLVISFLNDSCWRSNFLWKTSDFTVCNLLFRAICASRFRIRSTQQIENSTIAKFVKILSLSKISSEQWKNVCSRYVQICRRIMV